MLFSLVAMLFAVAIYFLSIGKPVPWSFTAIDSVINSLPGAQFLLFWLLMFAAFAVGVYGGTYVLRRTLVPPFLRWYKRVDPTTAFFASLAWDINPHQPTAISESVIDEAERELLGFNPLKHPDVLGKTGLEKDRALRRLGDESMRREWVRLLILLAITVVFLLLVFLFTRNG
jgi:hypothetical protein